jgi:nitrate reductase NapE component
MHKQDTITLMLLAICIYLMLAVAQCAIDPTR